MSDFLNKLDEVFGSKVVTGHKGKNVKTHFKGKEQDQFEIMKLELERLLNLENPSEEEKMKAQEIEHALSNYDDMQEADPMVHMYNKVIDKKDNI